MNGHGVTERPILVRWAEHVRLAVLLTLLAAIFFLPGLSPDVDPVFVALAAALAFALLPELLWLRLQTSGAHMDRLGIAWAVVPYALFILCWGLAWAVHAGPEAPHEFVRLAVFLIIVMSVARAHRAGLVFALTIVGLGLSAELTLGPRSVESFAGRQLHYRSLEQWSGYPEIGVLVSMGGAAALALMASPRWPLRAAAGVLVGVFSGALLLLYSRSALLTFAVVAGWLLLLGAVRFRSRLAVGALLLCVVGGALGAGAWPPARAAVQSYLRLEGWETNVRAQGWRVGAAMLRDHPWAGVGPTRYPMAYAQYASGPDRSHAYNLFVHTAAELGLPGLLAAIWLWGRVLAGTARAVSRDMPGVVAFATHGMLMTFLVRSQSEHFLANLPTSFRMLLLLAVLFGLAEAFTRARPRRGE